MALGLGQEQMDSEGVLRERLTLLDSGQVQHSEVAPVVVVLAQVCVISLDWACALSVREKIQKEGS